LKDACYMKLLATLLTAVGLLYATVVFPQQYNFRIYSLEEGLPRSGVYDILEDSYGYLWIGTEGGGVSIFNGHTFRTLSDEDGLIHNNVRTLLEDSKGNIWMGTPNGVSKYNGKSFTNYTEEDGLPSSYIRDIEEDKEGNIWFGTNGGAVKFDGKTFTRYNKQNGLLNNKVRAIFTDKQGNLWLGTDGGITFLPEGESTFEHYTTEDGLVHNRVLEIFEDNKGRMWFGTNGGISEFNVIKKKFTSHTEENGLIGNRVKAIAQDSYGSMWFGTKNGVMRYDGILFQTFTRKEGLSNERIRKVILDSGGNLWFATYFGGINKFSGEDFVHYTEKEGLISDQVLSIYEDNKGHILLGTFAGVSKLKFFVGGALRTVDNITEADSLINPVVRCVYKDDSKNYWFGTEDGINIMHKKEMYKLTSNDGLINDYVHCIFQENKTSFWIGTGQGVSNVVFENMNDISTFSMQNYSIDDNLAGNEASSICKDNYGNIWVGFQDGSINVIKDEKLIHFQLPEELKQVISVMSDANNHIWIATNGNGLFRYENDGTYPQKPTFKNISTSNGLSSNHLHLITLDNNGQMWVGSEKGVDRLTLNSEGGIEKIKRFGREEGFIGIETNDNAVYKDDKGNIWFGTNKGVARYNTNRIRKNSSESRTHIHNVSIKSSTTFLNANKWISIVGKSKDITYDGGFWRRLKLPKKVTLSHDQNNIFFEFIGLSYKTPSKVRYTWKLKGFQASWSDTTSRIEASYTNLPPGTYTFMVKSRNEDGVWNKEPTTFTFVIETPFWRTWWFYCLVILFGFMIFYLITQWRVKRLKAVQRKLERQVEKRTSELREEKERVEAQNDEISKQSQIIEEKNEDITASIQYAKRIQSAIMRPRSEEGNPLQGKMFVLYMPKDIVSGDFYWYLNKGESSYVTAADCTGHGVPGAFMSMIGITYLNQTVNKFNITVPSDILFNLRKHVVETLQNEGEDQQKDGMDMALCKINWKEMELEYAGANNPLYLVRDGELTEIKANKMPVGEHHDINEPFTNHTLKLQPNDMIYLFSDGYPDQFGGVKGKKFMAKRFKQLLIDAYKEDVEKQKEILDQAMADWRGPHEQIDDILVMGIRI
jgi:ligand-binding sensor domain-containing protein/serine phosphatase RsbU (regulator of sigma subunit)